MLGLGNNLARGGVLSGLTNAYSLEFDGTSAYVSVGDTANLSGLSALTISAWVKPNSVSIDQVVCSKSTDVDWDSNSEFQIQLSNDDIMFHIYDIDNDAYLGRQTTGDEFAIGQWYHIGCTWDGSTTSSGLKIYINGIQTDDSDHASGSGFATMRDTATPVLIGARNNDLSASSKHRFWNGNIDEVAIWNTALSAGSISNIYNNRVPTDLLADSNSANLQGWWRMGDGVLDVKTKFGLVADQVNPTLGADIAVNGDLSSNPFAHATDYSGGWSDTSIGSSEATWSSGNQTISCVGDDSGSNRGNATARVTAVSGQVYKVTFTNSTTPVNAALRVSNVNAWSSGDYLNVSPTSFQEFHFTSGVSGYVYITFSVYDANTWTFGNLKVVPVNGNAGKLISFDGSDFKTDTP